MQPGVLIVRAPEHADALAKAVRKGLHGRQCHIATQSMVDTQALALPEGASVDWQATYHGIAVVNNSMCCWLVNTTILTCSLQLLNGPRRSISRTTRSYTSNTST